ncbi:hypothetical protein M569_07455 [Genlisea aurea]|uniref:Ribosomal RNA-processing protein 12-like conserved domain-containing protein n=1 Tax=Genlisea aurea TaxID=192259 RepID=S8CJK0_9LAMI|nr:hypothetical protein M569_07455 [Genlisea aurea]
MSFDKFRLVNDFNDHGKSESDNEMSVNDEGGVQNLFRDDANRILMLEFASCFVEGSDEDLMDANDEMIRMKAYQTLNRMLVAHSSFCCSKFDAVMDLLSNTKSSDNARLLPYRFFCLQTLLTYALKECVDEENTKAFLILNEIIIVLKDSNQEGRKVAYDTLHGMSCKLRSSSCSSDAGLYEKFVAMICGYLSGPSPHIKSGVVSAISVLVYSHPGLFNTMPDVFHSVMELLHSKAIEVIKAVLGFVKVVVSSLQSNDLQRFLFDILDGVLRWSSVSRHYFRSKIIVILEIIVRKCGTGAVKAATPEKFKEFVQGVIENRHGKKSSSRAEIKDSNPDLPLKGSHKRKRGDEAVKKTVISPRGEERQKRKKSRHIGIGKTAGRMKGSAASSRG